MNSNELMALLEPHGAEFSPETLARVVKFHEILVRENEIQNLTRLISPRDFYEGHFLDVLELARSGLLAETALDLGSGCGVPGLLSAVVGQGGWSLADSEVRKAEFLRSAAQELGLNVPVYADRGEKVLQKAKISQVVVRAVGSVDKIYGWIAPCSTWNTLLLFKGPAWAEEWKTFQQSGQRNRLEIEKVHAYSVGADHKQRVIVRLRRIVPRGTS